MAWVTLSGFSDDGGPVDWLLVRMICGVGMICGAVLSYAVMGFVDNERVKG